MKIHTALNAPLRLSNSVVTIGNFDGLHRGHRAILKVLARRARALRGESVVVTFNPHTQAVIGASGATRVLTTQEEKEELISSLGVDHLVVLRFNNRLRALSPEAFMANMVFPYVAPRGIVFGYDHKFGNKRSGDYTMLRDMCRARKVRLWKVAPYRIGRAIVSSTRIRRLVERGDLQGSARFLGGGYPFFSTVEKGNGYGRILGYPTANLAIPKGKCLFPHGVYYGRALVGQRTFAAAISYGRRESATTDRTPVLEAHLLGFSGNLYGKTVRLFIDGRIRNQAVFQTRAALVRRIEKDIAYIKTIKKEDLFGSHN